MMSLHRLRASLQDELPGKWCLSQVEMLVDCRGLMDASVVAFVWDGGRFRNSVLMGRSERTVSLETCLGVLVS